MLPLPYSKTQTVLTITQLIIVITCCKLGLLFFDGATEQQQD